MFATLFLLATAFTALAAPLGVEERSSRPIPMYIHPKAAPHMCLTAFKQGQGQYYGARLYIHKCEGLPNQQFRTAYGDTVLWFQDKSAQGTVEELCVVTGFTAYDDPTVDLTNGRRAQLFPCPPQRDAKPTRWSRKPVNGVWVQYDRGTIKLKNANVCLDLVDGNTGEGGNVQQWQCFNGNLNQQWIVDNKGMGA
ncbi:hypothetical protein CC85DRAFT_287515 [Cutaneotrichosporon oleaginosum]|uniref:Ricin B lectin domain-containing protein n=1 Tax=Cutaneotrichosporon oleaginosum TaxID=879819 RepID=A0A0J0XH82_9TREE|nr:uncharacterized protein CC85DRAFT_287515 [Cutaneotrichosporon oleaginosum]KLT40413.1 hypothetical protein CC85DRAFT_287515 [Cutaneotrichosporon oleaginosum]TXT11378.1 hypothetical protein COLE_01788 [Cutaneotrichosporon oleaginosum]